jgi:hypothetical protein
MTGLQRLHYDSLIVTDFSLQSQMTARNQNKEGKNNVRKSEGLSGLAWPGRLSISLQNFSPKYYIIPACYLPISFNIYIQGSWLLLNVRLINKSNAQQLN